MKKKARLFKFILFYSILFFIFQACVKVKYNFCRDTAESFGNGILQILWGPNKTKSFYNVEVSRCYINDVRVWKEKNRHIYACGYHENKERFVKVNIDDYGEVTIYSSFNEMSDINLAIFKKLKK